MNLRQILTTVASYRDDLFGRNDLTPEQKQRNMAQASAAANLAEEGVPPLPESVQELLRVLRDPNFKTRDAVSALESDPALAAEVIHLANSAANARKSPCDTTGKAFARLGAKAVGDLAVAAHVMAMGANTTGVARIVVNRSVRVATILRGMPKFRGYSPERLFLCGLVHDIGIQLLSQSGEFTYTEEMLIGDDLCDKERRRMRFDHATLGAIAMKMWDVPDPVSRIVAWHHHLDEAIERGGDVAHMVATLRLAQKLEDAASDTGDLAPFAAANVANSKECAFLGLSADDLMLLWESQIVDELKTVKALPMAA